MHKPCDKTDLDGSLYRQRNVHRRPGYEDQSLIALGSCPAANPGRIGQAVFRDPSPCGGQSLPTFSAGGHGNLRTSPSVLWKDEQNSYNGSPANEYRVLARETRTSSNHSEARSQPAPSAQAFTNTHSLAPRNLPSEVGLAFYQSNQTAANPLASIGDQFANEQNATRGNDLSQRQASTVTDDFAGTWCEYQLLQEYVNNPHVSLQWPIESARNNRASNASIGGSPGLANTLGNYWQGSHVQRIQGLGYEGNTTYNASERAIGGRHHASHGGLGSTSMVGGGNILSTQQQSSKRQFSLGTTGSDSTKANTCYYGMLPPPIQASTNGLSPLPATHVAMATPTSSPNSLGLDKTRLMPPYDSPPFSAFSAGEHTRFLTRSTGIPIDSQRVETSPNSTGLPSAVSTTHLYRASNSSHGSSEDVAVCPYCGQVASRATKLSDRNSNLKRHIREKHERAGGLKPTCPEPGCGRTFERSDYVLRHRRRSHGWGSATE